MHLYDPKSGWSIHMLYKTVSLLSVILLLDSAVAQQSSYPPELERFAERCDATAIDAGSAVSAHVVVLACSALIEHEEPHNPLNTSQRASALAHRGQAYVLLAVRQAQPMHFKDAENDFRKALALKPTGSVLSTVYLGRGMMHKEMGNDRLAADDFRRAQQAEPNSPGPSVALKGLLGQSSGRANPVPPASRPQTLICNPPDGRQPLTVFVDTRNLTLRVEGRENGTGPPCSTVIVNGRKGPIFTGESADRCGTIAFGQNISLQQTVSTSGSIMTASASSTEGKSRWIVDTKAGTVRNLNQIWHCQRAE